MVGCTDRDRHRHRGPPRFPARQHTQHTTCCMLRPCAFLKAPTRQCARQKANINIPQRGLCVGSMQLATWNLDHPRDQTGHWPYCLLCSHFGYNFKKATATATTVAQPQPQPQPQKTQHAHQSHVAHTRLQANLGIWVVGVGV